MKKSVIASLLIFSFFIPPRLEAESIHPVINEVMYNPYGVDSGQEYITLYNPTDSDFSLNDYQLNATSGDYFAFPDYALPAKSFVSIHWASDGSNSTADLYTGKSGFSNMGNSSGWVALFNASSHTKDTIADYVEYGKSGNTWEGTAVEANIWQKDAFITAVAEGSSMKLKSDGSDANLASDWQEYRFPTPTPYPTNTPTPAPTDTPVPTKPVKAPTLTPFPKKISNQSAQTISAAKQNAQTPTPAITNMLTVSSIYLTPTTASKSAVERVSILGESTKSAMKQKNTGTPNEAEVLSDVSSKQPTRIFLIIGATALIISGILFILKFLRENEGDNILNKSYEKSK